MIYATKTVVY